MMVAFALLQIVDKLIDEVISALRIPNISDFDGLLKYVFETLIPVRTLTLGIQVLVVVGAQLMHF
jgi:hypothetical protein